MFETSSPAFARSRRFTAKFGWREATYRAHETATRPAPREAVQMYAQAFGVGEDWLRLGHGRGPAPSATRRDIFQLRQKAAKVRAQEPASAAGKRVRLARRLAGFKTVTAAAKHFRLTRTTLNAHEIGQNSVSPEAARLYALAFGVNAKWIEEDTLPSGYPDALERQLGALLGLHSESESAARRELPDFVSQRGSPHDVAALMADRKSTGEPDGGEGDRVPVIAADQLRRLAEDGLATGAGYHRASGNRY